MKVGREKKQKQKTQPWGWCISMVTTVGFDSKFPLNTWKVTPPLRMVHPTEKKLEFLTISFSHPLFEDGLKGASALCFWAAPLTKSRQFLLG